MSTIGEIIMLNDWFTKERVIEWSLTMGFSKKKQHIVTGEFSVTPSYIDDQGQKWGDTHIRDVGKHFEEYSHWHVNSTAYPIGGPNNTAEFDVLNFDKRKHKAAAPGVTGLIGEVLVTTFLQNELNILPTEIAHLIPERGTKAPDICLDIESDSLSRFIMANTDNNNQFLHNKNQAISRQISLVSWNQPLPLESKSSREDRNQMRDALLQLLEYWKKVDEMAGIGLIAQTSVEPITKIDLYLIAPRNNQEIENISRIINSASFPETPTLKQFNTFIGGRIIG